MKNKTSFALWIVFAFVVMPLLVYFLFYFTLGSYKRLLETSCFIGSMLGLVIIYLSINWVGKLKGEKERVEFDDLPDSKSADGYSVARIDKEKRERTSSSIFKTLAINIKRWMVPGIFLLMSVLWILFFLGTLPGSSTAWFVNLGILTFLLILLLIDFGRGGTTQMEKDTKDAGEDGENWVRPKLGTTGSTKNPGSY